MPFVSSPLSSVLRAEKKLHGASDLEEKLHDFSTGSFTMTTYVNLLRFNDNCYPAAASTL